MGAPFSVTEATSLPVSWEASSTGLAMVALHRMKRGWLP